MEQRITSERIKLARIREEEKKEEEEEEGKKRREEKVSGKENHSIAGRGGQWAVLTSTRSKDVSSIDNTTDSNRISRVYLSGSKQ